ncbi:MAG: DUF2063 domain-containing protein [Alphaproteobacteria bacterium]
MKLLDLQQAMRAGIVGAAPDALAQAVMADGLSHERRIQIYRNHYYVTLIEALAATFPVTHRLVGERFFSAVARRFAAASPPAGPCLFEYGDGFPALLESLPEAKAHPYLGDVARLEWAMSLSRNAPDVPPLDPAKLRRVAPRDQASLIFVLHPACRLFASRFPAMHIWSANQPDAEDMPIRLDEGHCRLLIHRHDAEVAWRALEPAEYAFLYALRAGRRLEHALAATAGTSFDLGGILASLIESGAISGFILPPSQTKR